MIKNKKGLANSWLFFFIIVSFLVVILLGIFLYTYDTITTSLIDQGGMVGQVNLTVATQSTMGKINSGMLNQANIFSILLLFGMAFGLIFGAYLTRHEHPLIFFVVDIIILIFAYIIATYISNSYETVITALPFSTIYTSNMNYASTFVLKLPLITTILGVVIMIVSYSGIGANKQEEVAGF